jgi:hypothetical protein
MFFDPAGNAQGRLLPPAIPAGFFGLALVMHVLAWVVVGIGAEAVVVFVGGLGLPLAALHMITLGVLVMTAMGAAYQLLPVATKRSVVSVAVCRASFWSFAPGMLILVHGFATGMIWPMSIGGGLAALGLFLFAIVIIDNLMHVKDMPVVSAHLWLSMAGLIGVALLGLVLIGDFVHGGKIDHTAFALAHMVMAVFGFMGVLTLGFSYILVPMFVLGPAVPPRIGMRSAGLAAGGLLLGVFGALGGSEGMLAMAVLSGLAAAGFHLYGMSLTLKKRMKKILDGGFLLVRLGWACLLLGLLLGLLLIVGVPVPGGLGLFGFVLVFGWLLTFMTGVLQRIMPFLASMHAMRPGGRPPLVSKLTADKPLRLHRRAHIAALLLTVLGIIGDWPWLVRGGAVAGTIAALAMLYFGIEVLRRTRAQIAATV